MTLLKSPVGRISVNEYTVRSSLEALKFYTEWMQRNACGDPEPVEHDYAIQAIEDIESLLPELPSQHPLEGSMSKPVYIEFSGGSNVTVPDDKLKNILDAALFLSLKVLRETKEQRLVSLIEKDADRPWLLDFSKLHEALESLKMIQSRITLITELLNHLPANEGEED